MKNLLETYLEPLIWLLLVVILIVFAITTINQPEPETTSISTDGEELCEVQKQSEDGGFYIDENQSGQYWYMVIKTESGLKVLAPCK